MTATVLELVGDIITPDQKATELARTYIEWDSRRMPWKNLMEEVNRYVYATDTSMTSNASLPWKNKTTLPKLCQISDNLFANYTLTMKPKDDSIEWQANNEDSNSIEKRNAIKNYMKWATDQPGWKSELYKCILDFIHKGNAIGTVEWVDDRVLGPDNKTQTGYVGPAMRRISPLDCVINPTADSFIHSPKFIRTIMSIGEFKSHIEQISNDDNRDTYKTLYAYLREIRSRARGLDSNFQERDAIYQMDGFGSYQDYLRSNTVEIITFYGDYYNFESDTLEKNRVITFVDRHKIISDKPNPSFFGYPPIYHVPWRIRVDNLWGMGPLENLLGMQYRIDHMENMKADMMDLSTYPVQKIRGFVEDYTWQPGEKIFVTEEGDVELLQPNIQVQQLVQDIAILQAQMEEMAGAPKEAMGFRSPGEKTKYEVQRLENAASRIFQSKINQFEEYFLEPILNAMLELARRNMTNTTAIPVMDDEFKIQVFQSLTVEDITGVGRLKAVGSRHFAEQTEMIQNIQGMAASPVWPFIQKHWSGQKLAKLYEDVFNLQKYHMVVPNIALAEEADAQRQVQVLQEQLHQEMGTATGIGEDHDMNPQNQMMQQQAAAQAQGM
jgi:hypothetical protein